MHAALPYLNSWIFLHISMIFQKFAKCYDFVDCNSLLQPQNSAGPIELVFFEMINNNKRKPHPRLLLQPDAIPTIVGFDHALRESTGLHGVSFDRLLGTRRFV